MVESYFSILDMIPSFDIDAQELEQRYIEKQQRYHPDVYLMKPERERVLALQMATDINAAYETLKDPLQRAEYLLTLKGVDLTDSRKAVRPDEALLMRVMEERAELMEAEDVGTISLLEKDMQKDMGACIAALSKAFDEHDDKAVVQQVMRLKYIKKFLEEARLKRRKLEH